MIDRDTARGVLIDELSAAAKMRLDYLSDESSIREDVPIDSLALLNVFLKVESHFDIELSEDALSAVETVGDLVDCITAAGGAE